MKTLSSGLAPLTAYTVAWSILVRLAVVALALLAAPLTANGQTVRYRVVPLTEIPSPAPEQTSCVPTAINVSGDVVGYCGAGGLAFAVFWGSDATGQSNGTVVNLGIWQGGSKTGKFTHAWGINVHGEIVGDGDDGDLKAKALVRTAGGWLDIDGSGGSFQHAYGITASRVIFGNFSTVGSPATETWDPVYWTYDAKNDRYDRNNLPKPAGTPSTGVSGAFVFAVNSLGVAVGQVASDLVRNQGGLWRNNVPHSLVILATPSGLGSAAAYGVSDDGRAVGTAYGALQPDRAVLWGNDTANTPVDLGILPGDLRSGAYGVNNAGQVVGASFSASVGRGFIYQNATLTELTTLLDTPYSAWTINEPAGINNAGTIIATGTRNGVRHPVMLVPFIKVKTAQTISFMLPTGAFRYGDSPFQVSASSTSGLTVIFHAFGACSIEGTTVTIVGTNVCQVTASQGGNADWEPAADVTRNTTIGQADSKVTMSCPANATYTGGAQTPCTAEATGAGMSAVDVTGLLIYANNTNVGTASATVTFGDANHAVSTATRSFAIDPAGSTVTVSCPASATYTGAALEPCAAQVTGAGGLNAVVAVSYSANTNVGPASASATFAGDANHTGNTGTSGFAIGPAGSTVTVSCPASATYTGAAQTPCTAEATGAGMSAVDVTGSLIYADNTNAGAATANASWAGDANHAASTATRSFAIGRAGSTVTVSCPASATYTGAALEPCAAQVTGAGGLNGVVEVTYSANTNVGPASASATFAGDANHAGTTGTGSFTITPPPTGSNPIINPGPQTSHEGDEVELRIRLLQMASAAVNDDGEDNRRPRGRFDASGLPPHLHIEPRQGVIRGHIVKDVANRPPYTVTVTYTRNGVTFSESFTWTVLDSNKRRDSNDKDTTDSRRDSGKKDNRDSEKE